MRVRDGVVAATDGPFAEAKEQFAGYVTVDVASEERAVEIAAAWPGADRWAMEVRAVVGSADRRRRAVERCVEAALRDAAPRVLSALVRRHGRASFDECEEAVQDALLAASRAVAARGRPGVAVRRG